MNLLILLVLGITTLIILTIIRTKQLKDTYGSKIKYSTSKVIDKYEVNQGETYKVKFKTDKLRKITLVVPREVYIRINLRDEGELIYSGKKFIRFDKQ